MKRQMGRRGRIWLLVLALAALLCACGQTAGSDAAPGSPAAAPEETPPMSAEQKKVVAEIESDAASMGQAPGPEDYSWQTLEQQPQADGLLVTASIYTLLLRRTGRTIAWPRRRASGSLFTARKIQTPDTAACCAASAGRTTRRAMPGSPAASCWAG